MKPFQIFLAAFLLYTPLIVKADERIDAAQVKNNSLPESNVKIPATMDSITVTVANDDEKTGRLDFRAAEVELFHNNEERAKKDIPESLQNGLQDSIKKMLVFQDDDTAATVSLSVTILKLEVNIRSYLLGGPTTTIEARYDLINKKTGDLIFTGKTIATGAPEMSHSLNVFESTRDSVKLAIQNNISQFLPLLKTVDVNKPMYQAFFITDDVRQRANEDLQGACFTAFMYTATSKLKFDAYQRPLSATLKDAVFTIGEFNSKMSCGWGSKVNTWDDADKRAIESCEKMLPYGSKCEVYAHNNHIVYVNSKEMLSTANRLLEDGNVPATQQALTKIEHRNFSNLTSQERGEYEYLLGSVLASSELDQDKTEAIKHLNYSWSLYGNVNSAIEEGNLRMMAGDVDKNWQLIRNAYQYFLKYASDEQKFKHPEAAQNIKLTEPYYQVAQAQRDKQERFDALKAKLDAQQHEREEQLIAIKAKQEAKKQEKMKQAEENRKVKEGDGSPDDLTCKSYGAKPGSEVYINCRIQIHLTGQIKDANLAEQAAHNKQLEVVAQQEAAKHREEQRAYQAQQDERQQQAVDAKNKSDSAAGLILLLGVAEGIGNGMSQSNVNNVINNTPKHVTCKPGIFPGEVTCDSQ